MKERPPVLSNHVLFAFLVVPYVKLQLIFDYAWYLGRSASYKNDWDKTDCEESFMNETIDQTDRQSQHSYKPRKLSYEYIPSKEKETFCLN